MKRYILQNVVITPFQIPLHLTFRQHKSLQNMRFDIDILKDYRILKECGLWCPADNRAAKKSRKRRHAPPTIVQAERKGGFHFVDHYCWARSLLEWSKALWEKKNETEEVIQKSVQKWSGKATAVKVEPKHCKTAAPAFPHDQKLKQFTLSYDLWEDTLSRKKSFEHSGITFLI